MTHNDLSLAQFIDHTLLKPEAPFDDYRRLCQEAKDHNFFSVCVPPTCVDFCREELKGSSVKVCTVLGFPLGYHEVEVKRVEAVEALKSGAGEMDMVVNLTAAINEDWNPIAQELKSIRELSKDTPLKLILETCYLDSPKIRKLCELAVEYKWDFVKTSTGFGSAGATLEHVKLMKESVKSHCQVKASGGIRDLDKAKAMIMAGATRLGTSASVAIVQGQSAGEGKY